LCHDGYILVSYKIHINIIIKEDKIVYNPHLELIKHLELRPIDLSRWNPYYYHDNAILVSYNKRIWYKKMIIFKKYYWKCQWKRVIRFPNQNLVIFKNPLPNHKVNCVS